MATAAAPEVGLSVSMRMTVYGIQKVFPSVRNVTCDQVERWRSAGNSDLVFLDVRPEEEYSVSHMSGAFRVDPNTDPSLRELGIAPGSTRVVCYCSVGYRSSDMARRLYHTAREAEPSSLEVFNMEGGLFQWAIEGRDMVGKEEGKASLVHPYSSLWGKLLPSKLRASMSVL